jgi:hypothetical protein
MANSFDTSNKKLFASQSVVIVNICIIVFATQTAMFHVKMDGQIDL